jgi:metallophosphoesterase superfamily enzyme
MNTVLLREGILLDARHAAWFPEPAILAVADLHLGYAWAHRHSGNLLPLGTPSEDLARLESLLADYPIRELVLLGDIVHTAAPVEPLRDLLSALLAFETRFNLHIRWIAGNHDRHLPRLTNRWRLPIHLLSGHIAGGFHFIHGDTPPPTSDSPFYVMTRTSQRHPPRRSRHIREVPRIPSRSHPARTPGILSVGSRNRCRQTPISLSPLRNSHIRNGRRRGRG